MLYVVDSAVLAGMFLTVREPCFVWAPIPKGYKSSREFAMELVEKAGVLCTPGDAFGSLGEGYVRFALVLPPEELAKAVQAVADSGVLERK